MAIYIIYDDFYLKHDTGPSHPENPQRLISIVEAIYESDIKDDLVFEKPYFSDEATVELVHDPDYLESIKSLSNREGYFYLDMDTVVSRYTYECALLAAGGCFKGLDLVLASNAETRAGLAREGLKARKYFSLVRPPGHHAFKGRGSGFCIFNNVALSARYAQVRYGVKKVAIIDFDVHHGNGTQDIFYEDPSIFYISFHQYPHYPGSGFYDEIGIGDGKGFNLNFPFPAYTGEEAYILAIIDIIMPLIERFGPELILVSAGYDAHTDDPLSLMRLNDSSYFKIAYLISYMSRIHCGGKLGLVLEGGYNCSSTSRSVIKTILGCIEEEKSQKRVDTVDDLKEVLGININYRERLDKEILKIFDYLEKVFKLY
ncbi:MAG: histone deacetylase [Actinobacteria bacterium]|nr:histone deacetylase [Actinomycetota bacterium]